MLDVLPSSSLSWLRRLRSTWYWASLMVLPYCRIVATRYGSTDAMTATQLLINSTRFPLPWDIGTPRHWNLESKHRDIGTSGHWNPKCTGRRKGTVPITGNGHRPEERLSFFRYPLGSHWRSLRCAFHCRAAHGGYDVLGGACWVSRDFNFQVFKWRGQSLDWCRAFCVVSPSS